MSDVQVLIQEEVVNCTLLNEATNVQVQTPEKIFVTLQSESPLFVSASQSQSDEQILVNIENNPITVELLSSPELRVLFQENVTAITLLKEMAPNIVVVSEQGPPGAPGETLAFETSDVWILSGPLSQVTLSRAPRLDTIKLFHNGLKEDSGLLDISGVNIGFHLELAQALFSGDRIEVVYNYED